MKQVLPIILFLLLTIFMFLVYNMGLNERSDIRVETVANILADCKETGEFVINRDIKLECKVIDKRPVM